MIAPSILGWAVETLVATTLLMLLALVIRTPVRKAFGPGIAYALWLMPAIRMLMPPLPGDWQLTRVFAPLTRQAEQAPGVVMGVMNPARLPPEIVQQVDVEKLNLAGHHVELALVPPIQVAGGPNILMLLLGIWALGALAFLAYHLIAHSRFCARLLRAARVDHMIADGRVRVIETDAAHGPLAFGIWRKYVAFPRDFSERYDEVERDLALAHELGHHVRGDLVANWVALVVLAIHWFNPVAWRAFRAFRADQEMACDALVLAGRAQALRHAYGRAIVKSAHGGAVSAACHLHTINELKGRLRMLSKTRKISPIRIAGGAIGVGALSLAALGLTASGTQAAERFTGKVERTLGVDLTSQTAPEAPPAPPAPPLQAAPEAPEAPAAPAAPGVKRVEKHVYRYTTDETGKDGKRKKVVIVSTDGAAPEAIDIPDAKEIEAMIPDIKSGECRSEGDGKQAVVVKAGTGGKKQRIIICTDRIAMIAPKAEAFARAQRGIGLRSALFGLHHARESIESNTSMSASDKAEALSGIDQAIAEVEKEAGKAD